MYPVIFITVVRCKRLGGVKVEELKNSQAVVEEVIEERDCESLWKVYKNSLRESKLCPIIFQISYTNLSHNS